MSLTFKYTLTDFYAELILTPRNIETSCQGVVAAKYSDFFVFRPPFSAVISAAQMTQALAEHISGVPDITGPIHNGATTVSGTSIYNDGSTIVLYINAVQAGTTTVTSGAWTVTGLTLATDDIVTVKQVGNLPGAQYSSVDTETVVV